MTHRKAQGAHTHNVAQRVAQIFVLYVLALTTAVACGQGFKTKSLDNMKGLIQFTNHGNPATFNPQITQLSLIEQGGVRVFDVALNDSGRGVYGLGGMGLTSFVDEKYVDGFNYRMDAACSTDRCTAVVLLLTRTEDATKQTVQNTYVLNAATDYPTPVNHYQGTKYTSAEAALQNLGL